jgi:hypothetical protein
MLDVRPDIASATSRMTLTFACRSAIRQLVHSLLPEENVLEMSSCLYAGSEGLLVLTDQRILAVRDDYSRYHLRAVPLSEVKALDYGPTVHDGFAALTSTEKVGVRRLPRVDSDRLVEAVLAIRPDVIVASSNPRRPEEPLIPAAAMADVGLPGAESIPAPFFINSTPPARGSSVRPLVVEDAPPTTEGSAQKKPESDKEILYTVLADLHGRGLLSAEELATRMAQIAAAR